MAEPEDPKPQAPPPLDDFDDDLVGFASPRALQSTRPQLQVPEPTPIEETAPIAMAASEPEPQPAQEPAPEPPTPDPEIIAAPADPDPEPEPVPPEPVAAEAVQDHEPEPVPTEPAAPQVLADPELEQEPEIVAEPEPPAPEPEPTLVAAESSPVAPEPAPDPEISVASPRPEPAPAPVSREETYGRPGATRRFERPPSRGEPGLASEGDARLAMVIYAFLIAAAFSAGATTLFALLLAWTARFWVKGWTRSHLLYQLRTSLIGVVGSIVGVLTLPLGLGVFLLSLTVIWVVARAAAGLIRLMRREEVRNPKTWSLA